MSINNTDLLRLKKAATSIITLSIHGNYDLLNYVNGYNNRFRMTPYNKIDTHIKQLKYETQTKLKQFTVNLETTFNTLEQLPLTQKQLEVYFKLTDISINLSITTGQLTNVYILEIFYPLFKRSGTPLYEFKRKIIKQLNRAKRGLNQAIKSLTKVTKKVDKLHEESRPPKRTVLNSNNWLNDIIENKYNRIVSPEAATDNNNYVTVEEKRIIKQQIRKQI